jgi:hydroxyacylglutathione hydrolase
MKQVMFKDVVKGLKDENVLVLDVRRNGERVASHIKGTSHIPLHELESRIEELPTGKEIWVHCAGAYRASAALGVIERSGRKPVLINEAFDAAHSVAELEFVEGAADHAPVAPSDLTSEKS